MKSGKRVVKMAKQIISSIRTKVDAVKARLLLAAFTVLSRRKKFSVKSIDRSTDSYNDQDDYKINCNAIVFVGADGNADDVDDDDKYPDLTHSLFDEDEEVISDLLEDTNSTSVIDVVKNKKENGEMFNLEDEIDEVADLFINKFHKRIRLQKILSFKRYQKMMETKDCHAGHRTVT